MAKYNLRQNMRGEDGVLYRAGENVTIPKAAKLTPTTGRIEAVATAEAEEPNTPPLADPTRVASSGGDADKARKAAAGKTAV